MDPKEKPPTIIGVVTEALPNIMFRFVPEEGGPEGLAYLSGRMRMNKIRVLVGDRIEILVDPYGGKGRIVRRL